MAQAVVDQLESIQIDVKQREDTLLAARSVDQNGEGVHEKSAVGQAGKRIVERLVNGRILGFLQLCLILAQHGYIDGRCLIDYLSIGADRRDVFEQAHHGAVAAAQAGVAIAQRLIMQRVSELLAPHRVDLEIPIRPANQILAGVQPQHLHKRQIAIDNDTVRPPSENRG